MAACQNVGGWMDFPHEVRFSAGIGPAHFPAETTSPLGRGCLPFSQKYEKRKKIFVTPNTLNNHL